MNVLLGIAIHGEYGLIYGDLFSNMADDTIMRKTCSEIGPL